MKILGFDILAKSMCICIAKSETFRQVSFFSSETHLVNSECNVTSLLSLIPTDFMLLSYVYFIFKKTFSCIYLLQFDSNCSLIILSISPFQHI